MEKLKDKVVLNWTYEPVTFIEVPYQIQRAHYTIEIGNGEAKVILEASEYENNKATAVQIHSDLLSHLSSIQIVTHKRYRLTGPSVTEFRSDGTRVIFGSATMTAHASASIDLVVIRANGTVISDTRQERINEPRNLAELINKYRENDAYAKAIIESYEAAVNDPDNELIHLYEIRDALSERFNDDRNARHALGISKDRWSRFGRLANDEPLRQGRHRGESVGNLRDASNEELTEARQIAKAMMKAYLVHLEQINTGHLLSPDSRV